MSPDDQVTDAGSAGDSVANTPGPPKVETPAEVEPKEQSQAAVKVSAVQKPSEPPRKSDVKAEGKAKPKIKDEPAETASTPTPSPPRSLASVMKVDLRARKKPHW